MAITYNNASSVIDGLVLHLDAANAKSYQGSGNDWNDMSGSSNNATLINGPLFNSANKGYFVFDGVDDTWSASISCNKTFYSIDWWIKPDTTLNYNQNLRMNTGWGSFNFHTGSSGQYWVGTDIPTRMSNVDSGTVVAGVWVNLCWTFNNGVGRIYKNGQFLREKFMNVSSVSEFTSISSLGPPSNAALDGGFSMVKLYSNKVLNDAEVAQNFEALRGRYGI